jgi:pantetheine-phosphate adenylyltransferase
MTIGIYAGTFDPITNGHLDIIKRSMQFCSELIILIGINSNKKTLFSEQERYELIKESVPKEYKFAVTTHGGLIVDFAKLIKASVLIRGIRSVSDFEYEINLANVNKVLAPQIETVFLPTSPELAVVSSSMVKEIAKFGGSIDAFVSAPVAKAIKEKINNSAK